jgi:hypothetical protein
MPAIVMRTCASPRFFPFEVNVCGDTSHTKSEFQRSEGSRADSLRRRLCLGVRIRSPDRAATRAARFASRRAKLGFDTGL